MRTESNRRRLHRQRTIGCPEKTKVLEDGFAMHHSLDEAEIGLEAEATVHLHRVGKHRQARRFQDYRQQLMRLSSASRLPIRDERLRAVAKTMRSVLL